MRSRCNLDLALVQVSFFFFSAKTKSMEEILLQNIDKDREIASLKAELLKLSQKSPVMQKPKRGLLANIKEAVTSPRKSAAGRSLRKTVRTPHRWKTQHLDSSSIFSREILFYCCRFYKKFHRDRCFFFFCLFCCFFLYIYLILWRRFIYLYFHAYMECVSCDILKIFLVFLNKI